MPSTSSLLVCRLTSDNMNGWTYILTILSKPKFLGYIDNQISFLTTGGSRERSAINDTANTK